MLADKLRAAASATPLDPAWNISRCSYLQSFSVAAQDLIPIGLFFKPDGLKMYVVGTGNNTVYEYNLSTAWNISTASFLQSFSVGTQEVSPVGLFFKPDGLKMYITGSSGDSVYEYNLSTAWNISTASFLQSFSVAAQDSEPEDLFFKPDGLKMYIVGNTGNDINEYNLSTAWNISTASFLQTFSVGGQDSSPSGLFFKPDGLKMYVVGVSGDNVNEYNLSTAWNISTASFQRSFSVAAQDSSPEGLFFKSDGLKMYIVGNTNDSVYEYNLV